MKTRNDDRMRLLRQPQAEIFDDSVVGALRATPNPTPSSSINFPFLKKFKKLRIKLKKICGIKILYIFALAFMKV
jgi:hypothetical protein